MTDDGVDHVGRRLRTLEECALHRRTIRLTCPACARVRRLDAVAVWWLFRRRGWDEGLSLAPARLCCSACLGEGRTVRPRLVVSRDRIDDEQPPYPDRREWRRRVARYRS